MQLYMFYTIYRLGRAGEPWTYMSAFRGTYCSQRSQFHSTGCVMMPNFFVEILDPSGQKYLWGKIKFNFYHAWLFSGAPTGESLVPRCTTTLGIAHLSSLKSPWTPVCTVVWTAPKWHQSFSWRIHTSLSMVAAYFLLGVWLSFSG